MKTRTELHTHFTGMLSAEAFVMLLDFFDYGVPIDKWENIKFEGTPFARIPVRELMKNDDFINRLRIKKGEREYYDNLNEFYFFRNTLLADLVSFLQQRDPYTEKEEIKYKVYGYYLSVALKELINQGVEYVEISYSNKTLINNMFKYVYSDLFEQIDCKFLLSTDRHREAKKFRQSAKDLKVLIDNGHSVGFDVMGLELPLSNLDLDRNSEMGMFKRFLPIIEVLNKSEDSTFRIHSGETLGSDENTENLLSIIEDIEKHLNIVIPPPQIRIGHGVYFRETENYLRLLKKYGCVVEINASSNYALSNIRDYADLPYNYYLKNDIPIVISSDGHGVYDTKKKIEDEIAENNASDVSKIEQIDKKILKKKKGG